MAWNGHDHDHDHEHEHGAHPHPHGAVVDPTILSSQRGIWALRWSFLGLFVTALIQLYVFWRSQSVALLADTIHNFGDAATAVPLWVAFTLATRKPTKLFTYGLGRVEDLAGILIVLIILSSAVAAAYESILRFIQPQEVRYRHTAEQLRCGVSISSVHRANGRERNIPAPVPSGLHGAPSTAGSDRSDAIALERRSSETFNRSRMPTGDRHHTSAVRIGTSPSRRNIDTGRGVRYIVKPGSTLTKRFASALAVGLVLFVTALPAAAACCVGKVSSKTTAMHSSMPCCAESCQLTAANTTRDRDVTVASTPSPAKPIPILIAGKSSASPSAASRFDAANERAATEFSSPPSFLIQHQFRI